MIPKIIHCVWLSGEEKPSIYLNCIQTWKNIMPDYEIKEWSLANLPEEVINHIFVSSAIREKKWAYATDYIRVWVLYNYGGIYMDMDVMIYKRLDPFLKHSAFSCIEFNPKNFYKNLCKGKTENLYGLNIEAAIIGAHQTHPWIKDILDFYKGMEFVNNPSFYHKIIMPLVISKISIEYGFKYIPVYQVLNDDVHIYPPDVFSSCYNTAIMKSNSCSEYGNNQIRYAYHLCAQSWYESLEQDSLFFILKKTLIGILGKKKVFFFKRIFIKKRIFNQL